MPFCGRDPYMGYSIEGRATSCWNCGVSPVAETIQALTGLTMGEVYTLVKGLPRADAPLRKVRKRGKLELPIGLGPLLAPHKRYLKNRLFDPKKLEKLWGLQGINFLGGRLAWRLFIPIILNGETVSWQTRRLDNKEPRYHAARTDQSIYPIEDCLYGIDYCRNSVILVEGCPDVWAIGPGACDAFGIRVGTNQFLALSAFPLRVVCFNVSVHGKDERAAQQRARKLCQELSVFDGRTELVALETGNDAASADPAEIEELRKKYLR